MKRNIFVGLLAAVLGMLLFSLWMFLEMRYSEFGVFIRNACMTGRPTYSYDDTMKIMTKWVRVHEFVASPLASVLVGIFVGSFCRGRSWLALLAGVVPIVLINNPSDMFSVTSALICMLVAVIGAKFGQNLQKQLAKTRQTVATT